MLNLALYLWMKYTYKQRSISAQILSCQSKRNWRVKRKSKRAQRKSRWQSGHWTRCQEVEGSTNYKYSGCLFWTARCKRKKKTLSRNIKEKDVFKMSRLQQVPLNVKITTSPFIKLDTQVRQVILEYKNLTLSN